ncbi:pyridoxamine 5'-phosphate oxidase family protein [Desulfurispora thermophila]|uniref:pyridoxamine 5'-phosphate oxidase family protein n=1 Tax=Desulfurispora thermophila TaxID=265470 RepID=UPI0003642B3E|nr:pyridoxamine 5'-phosphate oxidase family protein [Desulfurispora thermophila]
MEEILKYLKEGAIGAFATVNDGKPDVRPWQFQFAQDGKLYFATANNKEVYRQMQKNPYIAFTTTNEDFTTVRLYGQAVFTDDISIKEKIMEKQEGIRNIYKSADNPVFEAFYIEHGEAVISDFSGNPPRRITF